MYNIKKCISEKTTTVDGMMTFGMDENRQLVLDFKATEPAEVAPVVAHCKVQVMRNGDVYITEYGPRAVKRNPRVYSGKHITVTRRSDGSLRPNFKPLRMGPQFSIDGYAIEVMNELRQALFGLGEK